MYTKARLSILHFTSSILSKILFRRVYQQFINEMIIQPGQNSTDGERADVTMEDHVISIIFKDGKLWNIIFSIQKYLVKPNRAGPLHLAGVGGGGRGLSFCSKNDTI